MRIIAERWETKIVIQMSLGQRIRLATVRPVKDVGDVWGVFDGDGKALLEGTREDGYPSELEATHEGIKALSVIFGQPIIVDQKP